MWRALFPACALWLAAAGAQACPVSDGFLGITYDEVPANAPSDALVLDVTFDDGAIEAARQGLTVVTVTARVNRVVRGAYDAPSVRVGLNPIPSDCDQPFLFGTHGLIIGSLTTPDEGQTEYDRGYQRRTAGGCEPAWSIRCQRWRWPYSETVFVPIPESVSERRERTGHVEIVNDPE